MLTGGVADLNGAPVIRVQWESDESAISFRRTDGSGSYETLESVAAPASLTTRSTYLHLGLTLYSHATLGYMTLRINNQTVLSMVGDTRLSYWNGSSVVYDTSFNRFFVAGRVTGSTGWNSNAYIDDIYVDDMTGEVDSPVPTRRFLERIANGAGTDAEWTPAASTNVSQIDDGQPTGGANDGDSTYNKAESADLRDTFTKGSIAVPDGYRIVGVIPYVHCKSLDAGPEISLHLFDGVTYDDSADLEVPLDYTIEVFHRFEELPDDTPFTETDVNNLEIGYRSRGVYA